MCESSAFFKSFFTVWTALSASPLLCGYRGELVVWVNWYSYANSLNSALANCEPLSEPTTSGMPCVAEMLFAVPMVAEAASPCMRRISARLDR